MFSQNDKKMSKLIFIQPHKSVPYKILERTGKDFLSKNTDGFVRAIPSLPAMTILGALPNYKRYFLDATADNPSNILPYNDNIALIGSNDEEILDRISEINPNYILMTSMFTAEYFSINRLIQLIKNHFDVPIIVGGHHATLRPNWHLEAGADIISFGEGETNVEEILEALKEKRSFSNINGIAYLKNGKLRIQGNSEILKSLDRNWDIRTVLKDQKGNNRYPLSITIRNPFLYLPKNTDLGDNSGVLYASKGCSYDCEYCDATERDGRKIRHMSLERMIDLTEEFISFGANTLHNESDTFGIHPIDKEYLEWVAEQRKNNRNINLINTNSFFARYFFQNGEFLPKRVDLLKNAGFKTVTVSIESFNEKYNKGKLRGINISQLRDCFSYIKQQNLNLDVYMMYLFPNQTEEELKHDIQNVESLSHLVDSTTWRSLMYFPGTRYFNWAIKNHKFTEKEYRKLIDGGLSFYSPSDRFNFSKIRHPPKL